MNVMRRHLLILGCFLILVLLFFSRFLTGEQVLGFKDLSRYFYPLRFLMAQQVGAGHLPLWDPFIFCGFPLLATLQVGFFYPPSVIHYLLPFDLAFNYYTILHYFLAACFMYFLLQHYRLSATASFFGGVVFAFSGYLLSVSNMNTSLSSAIWVPLVLLFFDRLVRDRNFVNISLLGVLLALQFLGGEPTVIYVTLLMLVAYALVFSGSWIRALKSGAALGMSGAIALGLVAVQLLPFLELVGRSDRAMAAAYELVTIRSLPLREIMTFVFPYFYGNPAQFGGYSATLVGRLSQDWLISPYFGILPLAFVFLPFRGSHKKQALFFAATAAVFLLLAFGKYTPFYRLAYFIPGVSLIRYPVKYLCLVTFSLVVLSSFGFERLLGAFNRDDKMIFRLSRVFAALSGFLFLVFLYVYAFRMQIFEFLSRMYPSDLHEYFFALLAKMVEFNLMSFLFIIAYLLTLALLLFVASRGGIKKPVFAFLVMSVIIADLFSNGHSIAVPARAEVFQKVPPSFQILQREKGLYRFFYNPELEGQNRSVYGEDFSSALLEAKDNISANWHIPYHFYDFLGYESIRPEWLFKYYHPHFKRENLVKNLPQLAWFNVKYIASSYRLDVPSLKLLRHKHKFGIDLYLYEYQKAFPRAFVLDAAGRPDLLRSVADIIEYRSDRVRIRARAAKNGFLFLSDAYYPGWKAFLDGREVPVLRAKEYFRKIEIPAGAHEVIFVYDPLSLRVGAWISLLTLAGLALGGIIHFRKSKQG